MNTGAASSAGSDDYYRVLGLARDVPAVEIRDAYARAKERLKDNSPEAEALRHLVHEAYAVLSDPQLREVYDTYGLAGLPDSAPKSYDEGNTANNNNTIDPTETEVLYGGRGDLFVAEGRFLQPALPPPLRPAASKAERFVGSTCRVDVVVPNGWWFVRLVEMDKSNSLVRITLHGERKDTSGLGQREAAAAVVWNQTLASALTLVRELEVPRDAGLDSGELSVDVRDGLLTLSAPMRSPSEEMHALCPQERVSTGDGWREEATKETITAAGDIEKEVAARGPAEEVLRALCGGAEQASTELRPTTKSSMGAFGGATGGKENAGE
mmetsp:Transcript_36188/g.62139  ORF Transcript_36188/g.62139 Transcript_36188/m.62139 type:complete len:325 (-) Transcript_36188:321-1295(-)|eukprot:CAMPEP_0206162334 /NCGR_PEP_ID=MMETSP1474-20131121/9550_1 /ASSEMBLY_ACC=CAM_ASM_001110 /TAXON_ID=97495 /ORGANISM="Imantonia sp., Strain RCC918" /LENGTH=324 /DNA_ID=CAMNT_0053564557 /DNA_START=40 /DNA_END=1014 /DNA_ORIENTATION=-